MSIGLTDGLIPLGTFPLLEDLYLKGGFRVVADTTARDAIDTASRKEGMLVFTTTDQTTWRLGSGLTNVDWVEVSSATGDVQIVAELNTSNATPATIHTYTMSTSGRATIAYDILVTATTQLGGSAVFKIVAAFDTDNNGQNITERDITYVNGPFRDNVNWDVNFNISGQSINLQVVGDSTNPQRWEVVGYISVVQRVFSG